MGQAEERLPEKQGLKRIKHRLDRQYVSAEERLPEKQGLKLTGGDVDAVTVCAEERLPEKQGLKHPVSRPDGFSPNELRKDFQKNKD